VAQRVPALPEELDRYPDDRAEIVRADWAWNLMTSRWPGVVEPARHLVVCTPPEFRRRRCDPGRAWLCRVASDRVLGAIMAGRRQVADPKMRQRGWCGCGAGW